MRGAVSGGMALALDELGLARAFDAAYGSSAGRAERDVAGQRAPARRHPDVDRPGAGRAPLISRRRALRGGPVVDVRTLVEERYEQLSPGLFDAVLGSGDRAAPDRDRRRDGPGGRPARRDRRPRDAAPGAARLGRAAAARRPAGRARRAPAHRRGAVGGDPVPRRARGRRDARARPALAPRGRDGTSAPGRLGGALTAGAAARASTRRCATAFLTRAEREGADEALLARHDADPSLAPSILSVRPAPGSPVPSRLEQDVDVVRAGLEAGRAAAHAALGGG